jgi:anti-anti-sigma factor
MPQTLPFRIEQNGRAKIVSLLPELNECPWSDIERIGSEITSEAHATNKPSMVIDLSPLAYMGSAQVALVVRIWKAIRERNGQMVVVNTHPVVTDVLALAGLNKLWTIVPSRSAAFEEIGLGGGSLPSNGQSYSGGGGGSSSAGLVSIVSLLLALLAGGLLVAGMLISSASTGMAIVLGALVAAALSFFAGLLALMNAGRREKPLVAVSLFIGLMVLLGSVFLLAKAPGNREPAVAPSKSADAEPEGPTGEPATATDIRKEASEKEAGK